MRKNGSIEWPNSDLWCADGWAMKERHAKFTTFVPVRDGEEAVTFKRLGYVLNDAYCYSDPRNDVTYIEYSDWVRLRNKQWDKQMWDYYKKRAIA